MPAKAKAKAVKKAADPAVEKKVFQRRNAHGTEFNGQNYDRIIHLPRPEKIRCAKLGSKLDDLINLLKHGATMAQVIEMLNSRGKAVTEEMARNWFNWPLNTLHGYGVGRIKTKYVLIYPQGITEPLPNQLNDKARAMLDAVKKANPVGK